MAARSLGLSTWHSRSSAYGFASLTWRNNYGGCHPCRMTTVIYSSTVMGHYFMLWSHKPWPVDLPAKTLTGFWASISFTLAVIIVQPIHTSLSDIIRRKAALYAVFFIFVVGTVVFGVTRSMSVSNLVRGPLGNRWWRPRRSKWGYCGGHNHSAGACYLCWSSFFTRGSWDHSGAYPWGTIQRVGWTAVGWMDQFDSDSNCRGVGLFLRASQVYTLVNPSARNWHYLIG